MKPLTIGLERTIHAGGGCPGGPRHLAGEAGALDGLRAFLDLVLVAAAVQRHHLAGARPHGRGCATKQTRPPHTQ